MKNKVEGESTNVLATLRQLVPHRQLTPAEALRVTELQASRLVELLQITGPRVPSEVVSELPRIEVRLIDMPVSGMTHWESGRWVISLNKQEPYVRRRFSLFHEFFHIVSHNNASKLFGDTFKDQKAAELAEACADQFAASALMPKRWIKAVWFEGSQDLKQTARKLDVSTQALELRLWHLGLGRSNRRCSQTIAWPSADARYFRLTVLEAA